MLIFFFSKNIPPYQGEGGIFSEQQRRDYGNASNLELLVGDSYISSLLLNWVGHNRRWTEGNQYSMASFSAGKDFDYREVTIRILKNSGVQVQDSNLEGDSNCEQRGKTDETFCDWDHLGGDRNFLFAIEPFNIINIKNHSFNYHKFIIAL